MVNIMKREVLDGVFVSEGHSYANDALQSICTVIYPFDPYAILRAPVNRAYSPEIKKMARNQEEMIKLFNEIVGHGKDFALNFIKCNWSLHSTEDYIDKFK